MSVHAIGNINGRSGISIDIGITINIDTQEPDFNQSETYDHRHQTVKIVHP